MVWRGTFTSTWMDHVLVYSVTGTVVWAEAVRILKNDVPQVVSPWLAQSVRVAEVFNPRAERGNALLENRDVGACMHDWIRPKRCVFSDTGWSFGKIDTLYGIPVNTSVLISPIAHESLTPERPVE